VLSFVLVTTPQTLFELTQRVYAGIDLTNLLPIESNFLWMNLGQPDPTYILPILVFVTMFVQTKFTSPTPAKKDDDKSQKGGSKAQADDPAAAMTKSMQYTMPIMFGFFALSFQSGLSIYFVLSNVIGIAQGLYTRRIMEAEKEALASEKALKAMGMNGNVGIPEAEITTSESVPAMKAIESESGSSSSKSRSQSKRKRRSAKR
jgi:YidC/Oxa1 family membrane protein insertase